MKHAACTLFTAALLALAVTPRPVSAHGTDYRILDAEAAIVIEFIYSDNQPMRYAEVLVFSPENEKFEYQNGRTDMNGRFAFYPQFSGTWRIQADDGTGHLERVSIDIVSGDEGGAGWDRLEASSHSHQHHDGLSRLWGIVLGLSLILNIFMGFYLVKSRRP